MSRKIKGTTLMNKLFKSNGIATLAAVRQGGERGSRLAAKPKNTPPILLGGVNSQKHIQAGFVGVDWIQGSVPSHNRTAVRDYLCKIFDIKNIECRDSGLYRYDRSEIIIPGKVELFFDSTLKRAKAIHRCRSTIKISGSALGLLTADESKDLLSFLREQWFICTRIDVFYDDISRLITPSKIKEIADNGDFTGFRKCKHTSEKRVNGDMLSDILSFGTRGQNGSGKFLRIYDKTLESDGEIDAIRYEVEFSQDRAKAVFLALSSPLLDLNGFAGCLGGYVGGAIIFY